MADKTEDMMEFMKTVRPLLEKRLGGICLKLGILDLVQSSSRVVAPGIARWYSLCGTAMRTATGEVKGFKCKIGGTFGTKTSQEDVDPIVDDIVDQLRMVFYPQEKP